LACLIGIDGAGTARRTGSTIVRATSSSGVRDSGFSMVESVSRSRTHPLIAFRKGLFFALINALAEVNASSKSSVRTLFYMVGVTAYQETLQSLFD
jgi:hypothetical protein